MKAVTGKWHLILSQLIGGQKARQHGACTAPSWIMARLPQQEALVSSGYKEHFQLESDIWEENSFAALHSHKIPSE